MAACTSASLASITGSRLVFCVQPATSAFSVSGYVSGTVFCFSTRTPRTRRFEQRQRGQGHRLASVKRRPVYSGSYADRLPACGRTAAGSRDYRPGRRGEGSDRWSKGIALPEFLYDNENDSYLHCRASERPPEARPQGVATCTSASATRSATTRSEAPLRSVHARWPIFSPRSASPPTAAAARTARRASSARLCGETADCAGGDD